MTSEWMIISTLFGLVVGNIALAVVVAYGYRVLAKATDSITSLLPKLLTQAGAISKAVTADEAARASVGAAEAHDHLDLQRTVQTDMIRQAIENERLSHEDAETLEEAQVPSELHLPSGHVVDLLTK